MDIKSSLKENEFEFKKGFGQNFIFDINLLTSIAGDAQLCADDDVLEIGPGGGTLTQVMCNMAKSVVAYEIDKKLTEHLRKLEKENDNLKVVIGDFLSIDNTEIFAGHTSAVKVVANLPYYITTPIIFKLLESVDHVKSITIMVQKEVSDRLVGKAEASDMSVLSCAIRAVCDVRVARVVPRSCFVPSPNVDSAVVVMTPHGNKYGIEDMATFKKIVRAGYAMRRKTLVNNFVSKLGMTRSQIESVLNDLNISTLTRAESLDIPDLVRLMNAIKKRYP